MHMTRRGLASGLVILGISTLLPMSARGEMRDRWRAATPGELQAFLPARATVEKERIETEMRTATGIVDGRKRMIAAVVLITAGYSADGKYSHYLLSQAEMRLGSLRLPAGAYVLGWTRVENGLNVRVFDASTGAQRGEILAQALPPGQRVESFRIWPPAEKRIVQIGRFSLPYSLESE